MEIILKNKDGAVLHTANKYCEEDITVRVDTQEIEIIPSATEQVEEGLFNKVTVQGDANLVPENIKIGTNIFGVEGGFDAVDTRDANAIAEDIAEGKTAYVNNIKLTGAMKLGGDDKLESSFASIVDGTYGKNCTKLPNNLTGIRANAFMSWSNLAITEIPDSVTTIGQGAFQGCTYLPLTKLSNNLRTIEKNTFNGCTMLPLSEIPDSVTTIEQGAFQGCTQMPLEKLSNNLESIGLNAFRQCGKFKIKGLPESLKSIGNYGFRECRNLTITEIPSNVTTLGTSAFYECTGLTQITFKGDIKTIPSGLFCFCSHLTKVVFPNITSLITLSATDALAQTPIASGTGYIYVPDDLVDSFKSATNWTTYANQIKGVSELV